MRRLAQLAMLGNINQLQFLLSAIFVFLGATVFFVSSLISGRNIFRDVSLELALLVSTIVGFMLFAFSPISFLVFSPELFGIKASSELVWTQIQQQIEHYFFWPFILSAVGLGCVIGTLNAINSRTLLLGWLRTKAMLHYPILSYDRSWDRFFLSLKRGGAIRLVGKDGHDICAGKLKSFSIREESRAITVESGNSYRLVDSADLGYVEAPKTSFQRHHDALAHQAEAFYLCMAVAGLLLLVGSADLTSSYLRSLKSFDFGALAALYSRLAMTLVLAASLFIWVSFRASRQDFCRLYSYLVLCPSVPTLLLVETCAALALFWRELEQLVTIDPLVADLLPWKTLGLAIVALVVYLRYKKREIGRIAAIANTTPPQDAARQSELAEVCELVYLETDLNEGGPVRWSELQSKAKTREQGLLLKDLAEKVSALTTSATFLWSGPGNYLMGEDINIVSQLRDHLVKAKSRAWPEEQRHESALEARDVRMQR